MKNTIENIIIALVVFIVGTFSGAYVGYQASLSTTDKVISLQKETIEKAIEKNTAVIHNEITNQFRKIKSKKSGPINLVIDSETQSAITDTVVPRQKRRRRWFNRKNKKK